MKRIASQFALLALAGTMLAASPTLAAPGSNGPDCRDPSQAQDPSCVGHKGRPGKGAPDGQQAPGGQQAPAGQAAPSGQGAPSGQTNGGQTNGGQPGPFGMTINGNGNNSRGDNGDNSDNNAPRSNGQQGNGTGQMDRNRTRPGDDGSDMGQGPMDRGHMHPGDMGPRGFDAFRRGYRFPHFAPPRFDIRPGGIVPRDYGLRPLPPQIFAFYPMYRGYLFFVAPGGRIVIVSPRSLRIVAVL